MKLNGLISKIFIKLIKFSMHCIKVTTHAAESVEMAVSTNLAQWYISNIFWKLHLNPQQNFSSHCPHLASIRKNTAQGRVG